jgi:hypothetical protein
MKPAEESGPSEDSWMLTDGVAVMGPVTFDSVRQLVGQGRVSSDALVRHTSWQIWRSANEVATLSVNHREETVKNLAQISAGVDARASSPFSLPPPPQDAASLIPPANDSDRPPRSSMRPVSVDPFGVLAAARNFEDAMLLALSTSVSATMSDLGLVHRVRKDLDAAITVGGHGAGSEQLLGEKLLDGDPTLHAAGKGVTVIVEPHPGEIGRFVLSRAARCIPHPRGAVMIPMMLGGQLLCIFEFARSDRPYQVKEVARMQDVIEALAERVVVMGWS